MDISRLNDLPATFTAPVAAGPEQSAEQKNLVQAVKAVNKTELMGEDSELTFQMDRQTRRTVVRLVNRETKEVIRQIPSEYVLRLAEDLIRK